MIIHLVKNPEKGGNPAKENKLIIMIAVNNLLIRDILLISKILSSILEFISNIIKISNEQKYTKTYKIAILKSTSLGRSKHNIMKPDWLILLYPSSLLIFTWFNAPNAPMAKFIKPSIIISEFEVFNLNKIIR